MVALPLLSCFGMFSKVGSRRFVEDLYQALFVLPCPLEWYLQSKTKIEPDLK